MRSWVVSGALGPQKIKKIRKNARGPLQDGPRHSNYSAFGGLLVESGGPRVAFGSLFGSKIGPKSNTKIDAKIDAEKVEKMRPK